MRYDAEIALPKNEKHQARILAFNEFREFVESIERLPEKSKVLLDLSSVVFAHPSGMAPICAYIRHLHSRGWEIDVALPQDDFLAKYFKTAGWVDGIQGLRVPFRPGRPNETYIPLVSYRSHDELNPIINESLRHFSRAFSFQKGVLDGLEWVLNEVADNVLNHAGGVEGWLQLSQQPKKNLIEVVVVDCGRGILDSLRDGHSNLKSDTQALEMAVQKGVTRDASIGQGNGLAGSLRISMAAEGYVNLYSGHGLLRYMQTVNTPGLNHSGMPHRSSATNLYLEEASYFQGTMVSITLPTSRELDVAHALWGRSSTSMFEHQYMSDGGSEIIYKVIEEATGFGNRPSARPLRTAVENLLNQFPDQRIILDFSGVNVVSASFADEFVARLAKSVGIATFFQRVSLVGMNDLMRRTLDAVMEQRLNL